MFSIPFQHSYQQLPDDFYRRAQPTPVAAPALIAINRALADELGIDLQGLSDEQLASYFSGNQLIDGAQPLAMNYAGHQFGSFNPQLGDGRALLLGEVIDRAGRRRDIQLKGAGITPFSRGGDGRSPLGPVLREYLISEAMHAMGVPTTRALAAVASGEAVYREQAEPGAVFTRVAASHIRIGTFEFFGRRREDQQVKQLADYVINRHYPDLQQHDNPYPALLEAVCEQQAQLVAHWMALGFVHGVMNTDNMTVSGETIDYGPCAFMDNYREDTVFSSIDSRGRYAYRMQPPIAQWNMARLAECLLPHFGADEAAAIEQASGILQGFSERYQRAWLNLMASKIGLSEPQQSDQPLIDDLLSAMAANQVDFTLLFRSLADAVLAPEQADSSRALFDDGLAWDQWAPRWAARLAEQNSDPATLARQLRQTNPAVIPRNHRVAAVIEAAEQEQDYAPFQRLLTLLSNPYEDHPEQYDWLGPPADKEKVCRTFCGT